MLVVEYCRLLIRPKTNLFCCSPLVHTHTHSSQTRADPAWELPLYPALHTNDYPKSILNEDRGLDIHTQVINII